MKLLGDVFPATAGRYSGFFTVFSRLLQSFKPTTKVSGSDCFGTQQGYGRLYSWRSVITASFDKHDIGLIKSLEEEFIYGCAGEPIIWVKFAEDDL